MSNHNNNISKELYDHILTNSFRDLPVLQRLREKTAEMSNRGMQISPDQGQLMHLLAKMVGARKTLELGVFTGYSSLVVALALPEDGKVVACDISEEYTSVGPPFWEEAGVAHKIDLRIGPALETLEALLTNGEAGTFDFAFIDADKDVYPDYYELCLKLVRTGGLILFDNMFLGGSILDSTRDSPNLKAIRGLNAALKNDNRIDLSLLPVSDGLTLALKR